ncbi:MAG: S1 RNA-binding domain-containing protein [Ruminococcaceae bacterium]|nr:S1 RNA-binding domain-containing protein [Oscillospiraceae bacterium]
MKPEIGQIYEGKITSITNFGAFVSLPDGPDGMVHISEVSDRFVKNIQDVCHVGDVVKVKVISVAENGKIALSIKKAMDKPEVSKAKDKDNDSKPAQPRKPMRKPQENKKPSPPPVFYPDGVWEEQVSSNQDFEDMMSKFKKSSQDRMSDLKRGSEGRGYSRRGNGNGRK